MLWEPENLRYENLNKGYYNGVEIPSLISRICRQIVNSGEDIDVEMLCEKINLQNKHLTCYVNRSFGNYESS